MRSAAHGGSFAPYHPMTAMRHAATGVDPSSGRLSLEDPMLPEYLGRYMDGSVLRLSLFCNLPDFAQLEAASRSAPPTDQWKHHCARLR